MKMFVFRTGLSYQELSEFWLFVELSRTCEKNFEKLILRIADI